MLILIQLSFKIRKAKDNVTQTFYNGLIEILCSSLNCQLFFIKKQFCCNRAYISLQKVPLFSINQDTILL